MRRRPPRSTQSRSSAASDVYKRQGRQRPGVPARLLAPARERDVAPVSRPVAGEFALVVLQKGLFLALAARRLLEEVEISVAVRPEHDRAAVGRPDRGFVVGAAERETGTD